MRIRTAILAALVGSAGVAVMPTVAPDAAAQTASMSADEYARRQAQGDLFEIALSQLVLDKSEDDGVRAFAEQMVTAHTASLEKLRAAAVAGNPSIVLPTALDSSQQNTIVRLENISGMKFNMDYMQLQIDGHKQALDLNKRYAASGSDAALRQFAAAAVPMIQDHLSMAQKVRVAPPKSPGPKP